MGLRALAPDLWCVDASPSGRGGPPLPVRATVVRLPDGGLWIHSPVPFDAPTTDDIDALGPVGHLVAPSNLHHLWLGDACARWPGATTWAPPGLPARRPDLRLDARLDAADLPWTSTLHTIPIRGAPRVDERVFLHRPSGTLLVTDLMFRILRPEGLAQALLTRLFGTHGRLAASRLWDLAFVRDRSAFAASCREVVALGADRLVPCHGEVLERGAAPEIAAALDRFTRRDA